MSKTILVTGANSFIGCWIVKYLLEKGYYVKGTVRSKSKESNVFESIDNKYHSMLSFVYVNDLTTDSFDEAVQNVDGIIHVASPFHFKVTNPEKDLLLPAINGTVSVLKSAHKYNLNNSNRIRRIVITSSFASVIDSSKGFRPGYKYTENDWSPLTYNDGVNAHNDPSTAYRASKVCAEKAAWDFIENEKPSFTIATICEPFVFGPRLHGFKSLDDVNTSNEKIWSFITSGKDASIPQSLVPAQIDVRDVAFAHVAAFEQLTDHSHRYLIAGPNWNYNLIAEIVHNSDIIPQHVKDTTPLPDKDQPIVEHYQIDSSKAQNDLSIKYTPLNKTIEDLVLQLAQLKQQLTK